MRKKHKEYRCQTCPRAYIPEKDIVKLTGNDGKEFHVCQHCASKLKNRAKA